MNITLHLTDRCNLCCDYCFERRRPRAMSEETLMAAMDIAAPDEGGRAGVTFFGGEPLLEKKLIQTAFEYADELKESRKVTFSFNMTTNGTLLDDEFLLEAKRRKMVVALSHDGLAQDVHRFYANKQGTSKALESITEKLLSAMPYSPVKLTVCPDTVEMYADSVEWLVTEVGFRYIFASIASGSVEWSDADMAKLKEQYKKLSNLYARLYSQDKKFYFSPFEGKIRSYIEDVPCCSRSCELGRYHVSVAPDGKLYPCVQFVDDERFYMGDVQSGLIEGAAQRFERERKPQEDCESCALKKRCNYSCGCANILSGGDPNAASAFRCENEKMLIKYADAAAGKLYKKGDRQFIRSHYDADYPLISLIEDKLSL